jgi:NTP pyrophosphatase (non-canonical NTP hydrolase)
MLFLLFFVSSLTISTSTVRAIQPSAMMLIKKEAVPDDADLETFGAELVRMHDSIVNYRRPEMYARDDPKIKFYDAASRIQKAHPEGFKYCAELIEELGEVLSAIQETHGKDWEQMTIQLNKMIILKQQANMEEQEEKIRLYDEMTVALEKSIENCKAWKAIATRKRCRISEEDVKLKSERA